MDSMSDKFLIPVSIIVAGALVGGGFFLNSKKTVSPNILAQQAVEVSKNIHAVTSEDHMLGNPKARVVIVEYSDTECPFCKQFHSTMRTLMGNYGTNGDVSWVYRHFPIADLHSKAPKEAEALECAWELGGNSKFWEYTNKIYEVTPADNNLDPKQLPEIAKQVGLSSADFSTCLNSGKYKNKIDADIKDAEKSGAQGTPYSIIIDTKKGDTYPLPGAQPYANIKEILDLILQS